MCLRIIIHFDDFMYSCVYMHLYVCTCMYIIGKYCMGAPAFIPATPLGVLEILKRCQVETFGKTACVVGRSKNIGECYIAEDIMMEN